jgi:hypothetical protein
LVGLEAFLNELTELAVEYAQFPKELEAVRDFMKFMVRAEDAHIPFETRVFEGYKQLAGKKLDRGAKVFQDFTLLIRLRNALTHFKANKEVPTSAKVEEVHTDLLNTFRALQILAEDPPPSTPSWTHLVETKAYAGWACRTVSNLVFEFFSSIPASGGFNIFAETLARSFCDTGELPNRIMEWPLEKKSRTPPKMSHAP